MHMFAQMLPCSWRQVSRNVQSFNSVIHRKLTDKDKNQLFLTYEILGKVINIVGHYSINYLLSDLSFYLLKTRQTLPLIFLLILGLSIFYSNSVNKILFSKLNNVPNVLILRQQWELQLRQIMTQLRAKQLNKPLLLNIHH